MTFELERSNFLLQTLNQVAAALLDSELDGFENNLYSSMDMMLRAVNADRVSIWKNQIHNDELCATLLYEWSEGNAPQQDSEYVENISYAKTIPDWEKILSTGQCINGLTEDMDSCSRDFLSIMQVQSVFIAPIFVRDVFWGFVEFDDCYRKRLFAENEAAILRSCCLLIGNAFLHNDMTSDLQNNINELKALQLELEKALDEAKSASRSKSAFLANMSHEIRTPMNSIIGFSELALDDDISTKAREYFVRIQENSKWLLQIINDILDISKIESGKMELENIPFDLQEIFDACRTLIMPKVIEKGLNMSFFIEPFVGKKLIGDSTRLRQVFVNLLSNAVKFTQSGIINMQAVIKERNQDSMTMSFEIKDSGIGIAADQIDRILDPFTQAEAGTTRKFGGSGLGLSITKNIIEMMGGSLRVESKLGVGSKFSFEVTFKTEDIAIEEKLMKHIIFDSLEIPIFKGEILVCEDNHMNQQVICEHLARIGLDVVVANNGKEGVDLVQNRASKNEKQYDLILMDIHMPVMDGIEAASMISIIDKKIPIVALTANIMANDREIYKAKGMVDCVGKPFTSEDLWRCLMKYIKAVSFKKDDREKHEKMDETLRRKLINSFVKNNRGKFEEIENALKSNDIVLAHRIVHTLKSNAGQLDKKLLQKISEEMERNLKNGKNLVTDRQMEALKTELNNVLAEFEPMVIEAPAPVLVDEEMDIESTLELLEKLELLLKQDDTECMSLIGDLLFVPGAEKLIQQIEDMDFGPARVTLAELKAKIGV